MEEILIIDDSRQIADFLAETVLPYYGYRSRVVPTGWEGLAFLKQRQPDLILLDLQLPDTSGLDVLRQMGELGYDIPVILMTAHGTEQTAVEAFRLGAKNYLIKPFEAAEAGAAIERALRERRLQREKEVLTRTLQQRLQELTILSSVGKSVTSLLDLEELLERIVDAGVYLTHAEEGYLLLRDGDELYLRAAKNLGEERVQRFRVKMDDNVAGQVIRTVKPIRLDRSQHQDLKMRTGLLVQAMLQVPLIVGRHAIGVLAVDNRVQQRTFSENDQYLLSAIADYAAIAIENSRLFKSTRDSEQRYRELFDNANDMIFTLDPQLRIASINRQGVKLLGLALPELMQRTLISLCVPDDQAAIEHQLQRQLAKAAGDGGAFPLTLRRANGDDLHIEVSAQLMQRGDQVIGLHCIARDVTDRRRLELQLLQAEKLSAIGQLVAGVAHELNNPMTSIKGFAELLLRRKDLDDDARTDLNYINNQAERAARIVTNLLTFAREHQPQRVAVDVNKVIDDTLSLHSYHLRVDNIKVQRQFEPNLPNTVADPYQLQQVFLNLIGNAHQAMAEKGSGGFLTVKTERVDDEIRINIGDTGPGIPQHLVGRIFDPFFTTKPVGKGTGLGLSICYNILHDHGGNIWVDSVANEGTTFHLALPVVEGENPELLNDDDRETTVKPDQAYKILVVDDEEGVAQVIQRLVRDLGHQPMVVASGEAALQAVDQAQFDLILSDVKMPGMNGFQLYRALQQKSPDLAKHFIFITGDTMSPATLTAMRQIGTPMIAKPFSAKKLERTINEFMARETAVEREAEIQQ
ncbi:response regulator [Herpetosiphon llansteffanensis]